MYNAFETKDMVNCPIHCPDNNKCVCLGCSCDIVSDEICKALRCAYDRGCYDGAFKALNRSRKAT